LIDITAFKKSLYNMISVFLKTYDAKADQDADCKYAVYKLPSSFNGDKDNSQNIHFTLEVHVWDKNSDSTWIDDMCSTLDNSLTGTSIVTVAFYYTMERISPFLPIPDPVDDIQHREIRYLVKVQFL